MAHNRSHSPADNFPLGHSATSPQPQVSKRDKRRTMLADKLTEMISSFSENRDSHYRAQLAALQADINMIMKADPYSNKPLEDTGEEAADLIAQIMGNNVPAAPSAGTDYIAQVGRNYARFVELVNDALEDRDYNLTMLWNKHENMKTEIENAHLYKVQIAEEEHKNLAGTIRERLIATIQARTAKLRREKEALDLADSNAMLLHPNQYTLGNPASPGGPQAPRKTRGRAQRFGDPDDIAAQADNKRKRKLYEENDNESPGPSGRNLELGVGSPFREAKARTTYNQFEAPAYSLERLFTEKELSMSMNHATIAASNFFAKLKHPETAQEATTNGTNGVNGDHASEIGDGADMDVDSDTPGGALEMTRQVSSNPHATRGATRSALAPNVSSGRYPFTQTQPFILPANIVSKPNAAAPTPAPLAPLDVEQDLLLMLRDAPPDDALNEKLLASAVAPIRAREYQIQPPGYQPPASEITSHVRIVAPHLELGGMGGVPMSAQSSMGGYSDAGGNTPLGRLGDSALGGISMARTASGSGRRGGRRAAL